MRRSRSGSCVATLRQAPGGSMTQKTRTRTSPPNRTAREVPISDFFRWHHRWMALPQDERRKAKVAVMSDEDLRNEIVRCRAQEQIVKPNKARRSWRAAAEAAEEELERRG